MEENKSGAVWGWVVVVIIIIGGVFFFTREAKAPEAKGPITIGFLGPLTGDAANIGQNAKSAVEVAVEEINATGGISGRTLEAIYEDGKCNGKDASNAAQKLINVDKVPVILGGGCSGETASFTGLAEQTKTVVLSYCSSAPSITTAGDYIFRDYPSDTFQGSFAADYIFNTLKKPKVGVIFVKSDWGVGIKDVFISKFKELGGTVVAEEGYDQTARDLRSQLLKVKTAKPDLVYFLGYTEASIPALKQAAELKLGLPFFGGDAWDDSKIWTEAGKAGDGAMYSVVASNPPDEFRAKLAAKVGNNEVGVCSPTAYDALKIIAGVIGKVGANGEKIKNELYGTVYTTGVSSKNIQFDQNGDLVGANYVVKTVKDGKAEVKSDAMMDKSAGQ